MPRLLELAALAAVCFAAPPIRGEEAVTTSARQRELLHLVRHDCGSCHGLTMKGGLGAPLLPAALAEKADDALIGAILDGIKGTPMPPWRGELDEADATWIVRALRGGLDHVD